VYGDDHAAMRQAMSTLRPTFEKQILPVLTDAQKKKYDAIIAQHEKEKGEGAQSNTQGKTGSAKQ
jgi:hypothetical protein